MNLPHDDVDPDGLLEYSVVFTDRSLNHMSARYVSVMQSVQSDLRAAYRATTTVIVPGGGTYAMEAVARQLATGRRCLIVRNGLFSYRWSQILDTGGIAQNTVVCTARPESDDVQSAWAPAPIEEVVAAIRAQRSEVVFAPHVETAAASCCRTITCVPSRTPCTRSAACSCWTRSLRARCGSTWRRSAWTSC